MPSVRLIANKAHVYARHRIEPGQAFDALSTGDARVLTAAGVARYAPTDPPAVPPDDDRDATRESSESPEEPRRRRPYRRRDLVAEE